MRTTTTGDPDNTTMTPLPDLDTSPAPQPHLPRARRLAALRAAACSLIAAASALAMTSHAGWPPDEHLVMDKGAAGQQNTCSQASPDRHNYLLGGFGNDTIYGGDSGDVIWGDYRPSGCPSLQTAMIHAGNGKNYIYANDTVNYVWTGTNPANGRARARGLGRDPLRKPPSDRLHQPPRAAALQARSAASASASTPSATEPQRSDLSA